MDCNRHPKTRQTKHKAYQAFEAKMSQAEITLSSLDMKALHNMIQYLVVATHPGLFSVLSLLNINKNSKNWHIDLAASNYMTGDIHN